MTHKQAIVFSGLIWMVIGAFLLYRGLYYMIDGIHTHVGYFSAAKGLKPVIGSYGGAVLLLLGVAVFLGHLKGRYVLKKTVQRVVYKILMKPSPLKIYKLYGVRYYVVIAVMMCIGIGLRLSPIALDTRGFIDVIIGTALVSGAVMYFKAVALLNHSK